MDDTQKAVNEAVERLKSLIIANIEEFGYVSIKSVEQLTEVAKRNY